MSLVYPSAGAGCAALAVIASAKGLRSLISWQSGCSKFVVLTALSGVGKTFTGDYLAAYCGFAHIDGDGPLLRRHMPEYKEMGFNVEKAYREHWLKGENAPKELWEPYYEEICNQAIEASKTHRHVVLTQSIYRREARDFVRKKLGPNVTFMKMECDEDLITQGAWNRVLQYAKAHDLDIEKLWKDMGYDKYGAVPNHENYKKYHRTLLTSFEPFHVDEGAYLTVDTSARDSSVLQRVCSVLGLPVPKSELDVAKVAAINKARIEDVANSKKSVQTSES